MSLVDRAVPNRETFNARSFTLDCHGAAVFHVGSGLGPVERPHAFQVATVS